MPRAVCSNWKHLLGLKGACTKAKPIRTYLVRSIAACGREMLRRAISEFREERKIAHVKAQLQDQVKVANMRRKHKNGIPK